MFLKSNEVVWGMILQRIETAADGSGRFEIFKNAIDIWQQHFLFGIGWYNFLYYNINYYGMSNYVHNTHLEVLVELGIIGFTIYVLFHFLLLRAIITIIRKDSRYFFYLPVYIGFLIMMSSLSLIINETFFIFVALVAATLMSMKIQPCVSSWKCGLSVDNNCNINHK
jgi:O-antigen ligase